MSDDIKDYLKGVGIQSLSGQALASIFIPLPPLSVQQQIVEKIDAVFAQLDMIEKTISK